MGSSGGNIASYLTLAAAWDPDKIIEIAGKLSNAMFARNWWPTGLTFMPSWMIGYFKGSIYAAGTGASELFKEYFTASGANEKAKADITDIELWVGTLNRKTGKGQLFCNRKKEDCRVKGRDQDLTASYWSHDIMPLTYLDGNVDIISEVAMASASIPVLVPERIINGQSYVDGGTLFSSPLTPLQDVIRGFTNSDQVHIDYVSSFDMQVCGPVSCNSLYDNGTATLAELVKSICIQDRMTAIELLRKYPTDRMRFAQYDGNEANLRLIEDVRKKSPLTLLELYPLKNETIDLLNFKASDVVSMVERTRKAYGLRFWWITPGKDGESLRESQIDGN